MAPSSVATRPQRAPEPSRVLTLLDLVSELCAAGASDREVVASVMDLLETGRVRLVGPVCDGAAFASSSSPPRPGSLP